MKADPRPLALLLGFEAEQETSEYDHFEVDSQDDMFKDKIEQENSKDRENYQLYCNCPGVIKHSSISMCPEVVSDSDVTESETKTVEQKECDNSGKMEKKKPEHTILLDIDEKYEVDGHAFEFINEHKRNGKFTLHAIVDGVRFWCNKIQGDNRFYRCSKNSLNKCKATFQASRLFSESTGDQQWVVRGLEKTFLHTHKTGIHIIQVAKAALKLKTLQSAHNKNVSDIYNDFKKDYTEKLSYTDNEFFLANFPNFAKVMSKMVVWKKCYDNFAIE